jgi:hypothetical protein
MFKTLILQRLYNISDAQKVIDTIFYRFTQQLEEKKVITYSGSIIDATFVDVPRQRNSRSDNKTIKEGGVPEEWEKEANKNKRRQKDTDAWWAKKNNEAHYSCFTNL